MAAVHRAGVSGEKEWESQGGRSVTAKRNKQKYLIGLTKEYSIRD
jgi:hypothetical protein